jgi:hypothetical protein
MDVAAQLVQKEYPGITRKQARTHYRAVTGRGIQDRGRRKLPKPPRFTAK